MDAAGGTVVEVAGVGAETAGVVFEEEAKGEEEEEEGAEVTAAGEEGGPEGAERARVQEVVETAGEVRLPPPPCAECSVGGRGLTLESNVCGVRCHFHLRNLEFRGFRTCAQVAIFKRGLARLINDGRVDRLTQNGPERIARE